MSTGAMPNQPHSQTQYDGLAETRTNNDMQGMVYVYILVRIVHCSRDFHINLMVLSNLMDNSQNEFSLNQLRPQSINSAVICIMI